MVLNKENILKALKQLRAQKERKFTQSVDLIINLRDFDIKKNSINLFVQVPHTIKKPKICAFLSKKVSIENIDINVITKDKLEKLKDKKQIKKLAKEYDFFISHLSLMPKIATSLGRILGPVGKMPSPQLGILADENEATIKNVVGKIEKTIKIKTKEPSIKICIGKEKMQDNEIADNAISVYNAVLDALPKKKENIKNIMLKFTMSKPVKIEQEEKKDVK